ncbi:uncharacterized protein C8Q71DRAFT_854406 [Rhodofomes roseus]|uniref:Uncharacterized protein n=1 Tax=Rhodofomes roseus TaxID=34475 RepID=A0ABQ8KTA3_9APHY|nr:uncharacterized protein C8Q71DRAFT_854406 [Rhodofomes roseus]KAH9842050.1 hypothetical protein C8Q71DRAFT_854406 [Rhodofomes roseus]
MSSIRYVYGHGPHIVADPGSDEGHVSCTHFDGLPSKAQPAITDDGVWEGDTEGASLSPPLSSASDPTSSPVLGPGHYDDIVELGGAIKKWHFADKIFGELLEEPDFPRLFNTLIIRNNITEQDWKATRLFIEDHMLLLRYLSFVYNPAMGNLEVYGPSSLHQIVNDSMTNAVNSAVTVSSPQAVSMDGTRGLLNDNVGHTLDTVMTIATTKRLSTTDSIRIVRDTFVNETSYTQILKNVLNQLHVAMRVCHNRGPLLFTAINLEELEYKDPDKDKSEPDDKGFVAGCGEGNDILSTGWKRGGEVLVGRLQAQLFVFIPEDRQELRHCLDNYSVPQDWVHWRYCVPIQRRYEEGSEVAQVRDHVVNKYQGAIRDIREAAHNQRLSAMLSEVIKTNDKHLIRRAVKELEETPNFSHPSIPDPIPSLANDIWIAAYQMAEDKWANHGYRIDNNDPDAPAGADERAMLREVAASMKRRLDNTEKDGDDEIIASFRKKQRVNTPPPQTNPVQLQEDAHSDESANSSFEPQSGGSGDSSFEAPLNLITGDLTLLATGRELRSETSGRR